MTSQELLVCITIATGLAYAFAGIVFYISQGKIMNGVLAEWKQKRAFDLLADLEHMFGVEALTEESKDENGRYEMVMLSKAGQRIWEACDIACPSTVSRLIRQYCDFDSESYSEIRNYPNRMGGKFKKRST